MCHAISYLLIQFKISTSIKSHPGHLHVAQQATHAAGFAHLLEHLLHLDELAPQLVHFLLTGARAFCNAFAPAAADDLMMVALIRRHGVDDGFEACELFFVHIVSYFIQPSQWTDLGQHTHNALHGTEFADLVELVTEIAERESAATE